MDLKGWLVGSGGRQGRQRLRKQSRAGRDPSTMAEAATSRIFREAAGREGARRHQGGQEFDGGGRLKVGEPETQQPGGVTSGARPRGGHTLDSGKKA